MWPGSFLKYLTLERNYSQRTVKEYQDDLKAFELFYKDLDETLTWETVDVDIVRNWIVKMLDSGLTSSTVNRRLSALRTFYKYLLKCGWIKYNPIRSLKGPKKEKVLPAFLREEEMDRLLSSGFFEENFLGRRDRLMISLFYETGVRLSELTSLDDVSVDLGMSQIKVTGKRNKQRIIPFGEHLQKMIQEYLNEKKVLRIELEAFFVDELGCRLKNDKVRFLVRYYLNKVSTLKKRSPHVLRHTFATAMLNNNADLETLKDLLGHESVSTTEIYTHTTFEELKKMYNQAHPRA